MRIDIIDTVAGFDAVRDNWDQVIGTIRTPNISSPGHGSKTFLRTVAVGLSWRCASGSGMLAMLPFCRSGC